MAGRWIRSGKLAQDLGAQIWPHHPEPSRARISVCRKITGSGRAEFQDPGPGGFERSPKNTYIRSPKNDRIFQVFRSPGNRSGSAQVRRSWGIRGSGKITWKLGWPGFLGIPSSRVRVPTPGMSEGVTCRRSSSRWTTHRASQETSVYGRSSWKSLARP